MACNIQLNDGILFTINAKNCDDTVKNISGASDLAITFWRPNDTSFTQDASLTTDGSDGSFRVVASGDLCGRWRIQGSMTLNGRPLHTEIGRFKVVDNL